MPGEAWLMAGRIRSIKPEILEDEKTAALSHLEWRLFVSLWLIADDHGNLRGEPGYVQGQTLWAANETRAAVAAALDALTAVDLLTPYTVRGQSYFHITGWARHQKVDKPGKPRMPGPNEADEPSSRHVALTLGTFAESSRESRESLEPDLRPPTSDQDHDRESLARTIPGDGGQSGSREPGPRATQQGAATTDQGASSAAGNVAESQLDPTGHRVERPPSPGPSTPAAPPLPGPLVTTPDEIRAELERARRGDRDPSPANVPPGESAWHRRQRWWGAMLEADARLRAAGIEPNAPALPKAPAGVNESNMVRCERQLLDGGATPDEVDAKMRHIVLVAEAEALRGDNRSRRWFKPALIWDPERAARSADTSLQEARKSRPAPASTRRGDPLPPAPAPPRPDRPPPDPVLSPEDRAEILALAARVGVNPEAVAAAELARGRVPAHMPTAELVKRFGDGQRAPPDDPIADEPRKPPARRKAAT